MTGGHYALCRVLYVLALALVVCMCIQCDDTLLIVLLNCYNLWLSCSQSSLLIYSLDPKNHRVLHSST